MNHIEMTASEKLVNSIVSIPWAAANVLAGPDHWRDLLGFIEGAQGALISVDVDKYAEVAEDLQTLWGLALYRRDIANEERAQ